MNLVKTSMLTFIATVIKVLSGLVINKAISIFIGPSGLALIGQFQNSIGIIQSIARGGINSGVTKYTAEYAEDFSKTEHLWSSALRLTLIFSFLTSTFIILFNDYLSKIILKSDSHGYIFIVFGFTLILFSINQLLLSIINGLKEIKLFISVNIAQSIYGLVFTTLLVAILKIDGALLAIVTNQSVVFFYLLWKLRGRIDYLSKRFRKKLESEHSRKLLKYSLMSLTSAFCLPISLMIIRNHLGDNYSWESAGHWQAMTYISSMYLMVVTTALSTYYLPRLSEINNKKELRVELKRGYIILLPIVIILSFALYILKDIVISILFSKQFFDMRELFKWQLIGDTLKISSWLLSYLMLAKAMTRTFIFTELVFSLFFVVSSIFFINSFGVVGVTYSYSLSYFLYFFLILYLMKKHIMD